MATCFHAPWFDFPFGTLVELGNGVDVMRSSMAVLAAAIFVSTSAWGKTVYVIDEADCRELTLPTPAPNVALKHGVNARGRPVALADLGGALPIKIPGKFSIDIVVFLVGRL